MREEFLKIQIFLLSCSLSYTTDQVNLHVWMVGNGVIIKEGPPQESQSYGVTTFLEDFQKGCLNLV